MGVALVTIEARRELLLNKEQGNAVLISLSFRSK